MRNERLVKELTKQMQESISAMEKVCSKECMSRQAHTKTALANIDDFCTREHYYINQLWKLADCIDDEELAKVTRDTKIRVANCFGWLAAMTKLYYEFN